MHFCETNNCTTVAQAGTQKEEPYPCSRHGSKSLEVFGGRTDTIRARIKIGLYWGTTREAARFIGTEESLNGITRILVAIILNINGCMVGKEL